MQLRNSIISPDKALTGAIYTEITDVEGELNGFITYDRQVVKLDYGSVQAINNAFNREASTVIIGGQASS